MEDNGAVAKETIEGTVGYIGDDISLLTSGMNNFSSQVSEQVSMLGAIQSNVTGSIAMISCYSIGRVIAA